MIFFHIIFILHILSELCGITETKFDVYYILIRTYTIEYNQHTPFFQIALLILKNLKFLKSSMAESLSSIQYETC